MIKLAAFVFVLSLAAIALPVTSADAQMGGGGRHRGGGAPKDAPKAPKVDDKAYKAALERIPDSKEKFDPWGSIGVPSSQKKPK
ncbi:MAG: hypothetical protein JSS22_04570 [Proteobacteria bacterium]|nr:hypothetical protein [Pseudomonadota bacterium]